MRLPESAGKISAQRTTKNTCSENKKKVHISYPLDHPYFVPPKPRRWFPKTGFSERKKEGRNERTYRIKYEDYEQLKLA